MNFIFEKVLIILNGKININISDTC